MKAKVIQEFEGEINSIKFFNEKNFTTVEWLLGIIEEKFGACYTDRFIANLSVAIEEMEGKYENFSFQEMEYDFLLAIENATKFEDIQFTYRDNDWKLEKINESIKKGAYNIKEIVIKISNNMSEGEEMNIANLLKIAKDVEEWEENGVKISSSYRRLGK